jgi:hypothetical protein
LFVNAANDRVGIGTTSPVGKLDVVQDNASFTMVIGSDLTATTRTDATRKAFRIGAPHYTNAEEPIAMFIGDMESSTTTLKFGGGTSVGNSATEIQFFTAANTTTTTGTQRVTINSSGNVGIGTITPTSKLHIVDDWGSVQTSNTQSSSFSLFPNSGNTTAFTIFRRGSTTTRAFFVGINSAGSTEIGTINGSISFNTSTLHLAAGSGGNVGIGTVTPNERLTVVGNISATGSVTANNLVYKDGNTEGAALTIGTNDTQDLNFETNGTSRMTVTSAGNVGIGITTPTAGYKLDVVGALRVTSNILSQGSILYLNSQQALTQGTNSLTLGGATYYTTLTYGNASTTNHNFVAGSIGIGTTTPNEKLTVVGNISATGNLNIGGGMVTPITTINTNTTLSASNYVVMADSSSGSIVIQLPAASIHTGRTYHIKKIDSSTNLVTLSGNIAETIDGLNTQAINTQYISLTIVSNGSNWFII